MRCHERVPDVLHESDPMIESSDRMNVEFDRSLRALMTGKNDSCGTIEHEQVNEDQSSRSRDRSSGTDPLERVILES